LRYVGKLARLYPTDPLEALAVDEVMAHANDLEMTIAPMTAVGPLAERLSNTQADELRASLVDVVCDDLAPVVLARLEKLAATSPTGWIAGTAGPSIADLRVTAMVDFFRGIGNQVGIIKPGTVDRFSKLIAIRDKVHAQPAIAQWEAAHPVVVSSMPIIGTAAGADS